MSEKCHITFENFWGEELKFIHISHSNSPFVINTKESKYNFTGSITYVKDKEIVSEALTCYYTPGQKNYWQIHFTTLYDQAWHSTYNFSCAIKPEDNHRVIIGVNKESERMYVAFPASSPCSTALKKSYF